MKADRPIVPSRLAMDWYYVTQGFFVWKLWRDIRVRYAFINRNFPSIALLERIDLGWLREEIEHVKSLAYTQTEIGWLREHFHENQPNGFLTDEYLDWLQTTPLADTHIDTEMTPNGRRIKATIDGEWGPGLPWETHLLPIITQLNAEHVLREAGVTMDEARAEGRRRYAEKLAFLKQFPGARFGSFGLRRQLCFAHSYDIDEMSLRFAPEQITGISNVYHAMLLGAPPTGTFAHQLPMVYVAMARARGESDTKVREAHMRFFDDWASTFSTKWLTAVPDTFGSEAFWDDFGSERAALWPNYKQDSGNPFERGEYYARRLRGYGIDPRTKILVPTDGLDERRIAALTLEFERSWKAVATGWGTNNSNDVGYHTYGSFVVKPDLVILPDGRSSHAVKLSDNNDKHTGNEDEVEANKRIFGHQNTYAKECVV